MTDTEWHEQEERRWALLLLERPWLASHAMVVWDTAPMDIERVDVTVAEGTTYTVQAKRDTHAPFPEGIGSVDIIGQRTYVGSRNGIRRVAAHTAEGAAVEFDLLKARRLL